MGIYRISFRFFAGIVLMLNQVTGQTDEAGFSLCANLNGCLEVSDNGCVDGLHQFCMKILDDELCQPRENPSDTTLDIVCLQALASGALIDADPLSVRIGEGYCHSLPADQAGLGAFYIFDTDTSNLEVGGGPTSILNTPMDVSCGGTSDVCGETDGITKFAKISFGFTTVTCPPPNQFKENAGFGKCANLQYCLEVVDNGCDSGMHQYCMRIIDSPFCQGLAELISGPIDLVCESKPIPGSSPLRELVPLGSPVCLDFPTEQIGNAGFYIFDTDSTAVDIGGGPNSFLSISSGIPLACTADGVAGKCGESDNIAKFTEISFDITACPATTTPTPTTATTTATTTMTTTTTAATTSVTTTTPRATTAKFSPIPVTTLTAATSTTATTTTAATTSIALPVLPNRSPASGCSRTPGPCSVTCGTGTRSLVKTCGGRSVTDIELCTLPACDVTPSPPGLSGIVNGGYGPWSAFGACTQTCVTSGLATPTRNRRRVCDDPSPSNGGLNCINTGLGEAIQRVSCNELQACPTRTRPPVVTPPQTVLPQVNPLRCGYNEKSCRQGCCRRGKRPNRSGRRNLRGKVRTNRRGLGGNRQHGKLGHKRRNNSKNQRGNNMRGSKRP